MVWAPSSENYVLIYTIVAISTQKGHHRCNTVGQPMPGILPEYPNHQDTVGGIVSARPARHYELRMETREYD